MLTESQLADEFTRRHAALVRRAKHILRSGDEDAEDAVQNAFMKAWVCREQYRGEAAVGSWLFQILNREALTVLRSRRTNHVKHPHQLSEFYDIADQRTPDLDEQIDQARKIDGIAHLKCVGPIHRQTIRRILADEELRTNTEKVRKYRLVTVLRSILLTAA